MNATSFMDTSNQGGIDKGGKNQLDTFIFIAIYVFIGMYFWIIDKEKHIHNFQ